jgi:tetratricopeptide (TPR) repeat protein
MQYVRTIANESNAKIGWKLGLMIACISMMGCRVGGIGQNTVGVQLYQQGRYAEALQQFEAAKQTDPGNPDTYYNLASTYHRMGVTQKDSKLIEQSEALYNQCLDLSPNHTACYRGLSVLLVETNRSDKAFTLLKNWTSRSPTLPDARIELAKLHQEFKQTKVAEQYLDEALSMDPNNAIAWAAKGRLREETGDLAQARQNYSQSLALNSLQPEVYQRVAALDLRMGQQALQNTIIGTQTTIANGTGPGTAAGTTTQNGGNMTSQAPNTSSPRY